MKPGACRESGWAECLSILIYLPRANSLCRAQCSANDLFVESHLDRALGKVCLLTTSPNIIFFKKFALFEKLHYKVIYKKSLPRATLGKARCFKKY